MDKFLPGEREAINQGRCSSLLRPDDGEDCTFKPGEEFKLRSCRIVIRKTHRIKRDRKRHWRIEFDRYVKDRLYLLARGAGDGRGYVDNPDLAQRAQDPIAQDQPDGPSPGERDAGIVGGNRREPPEPEAVPPHEIPNYTASKEARAAYERQIEEERARQRELPLGQRIANIKKLSAERHLDISGDLTVIEQRVEKVERKLAKRG